MQLNTHHTNYPILFIFPEKSPKRLVIVARKGDFKAFHLKKNYHFGEPIPIPPDRVILVTIPDGVFRCNLNKGIFAEDRKFIQNEDCDYPHIIKFPNLSREEFPTLTIKVHYAYTDKDVIVEFV